MLALSGWGLSVRVQRRRLVVADGLSSRRREGAFFRASSPIKRLVLIGRAGMVTLEAVAWLHDTGASLVQLDWDGTVLLASSAWGNNDARLRRAQALAPGSGVGIAIARSLIAEKLRGQLGVLSGEPGAAEAAVTIAAALARVDGCATPAELLRVEAEAAACYWRVLAATPLRFARKDLVRIPPHWLTLGPRSSPLTSSPRRAATAGQALINLAYGAAEAEAVIACATIGLDAALGVLHADQRARNSMALDLLEVCRPAIDRYMLDLIAATTFTARDFREDRHGQVWVSPLLARQIAEASPLWAHRLGPAAERIAKTLARGPGSRLRTVPTLLTQEARSRGRDRIRHGRRKLGAPTAPVPRRACQGCGTPLDRDRVLCDDCRPEQRREQGAAFSAAARATLARLRTQGIDPSASPQAKAKIGRATARTNRDAKQWEREHARPDPAVFTREILPLIAQVPLRRLADATGLSIQHCGLIRRGLRIPHPRHWAAIADTARSTTVS